MSQDIQHSDFPYAPPLTLDVAALTRNYESDAYILLLLLCWLVQDLDVVLPKFPPVGKIFGLV